MKHSKPAVLVGPRQKRILYIITALLWASGAAWLYFRYFGQVQTEFGLQASPVQALSMRIHGAAAMAFLMVFGAFLLEHVPAGWNENRQRPSGSTLLGVCAVLTVTGWGLYYLVDKGTRQWVSVIHGGLGLLLPAIIAAHVILKKDKA